MAPDAGPPGAGNTWTAFAPPFHARTVPLSVSNRNTALPVLAPELFVAVSVKLVELALNAPALKTRPEGLPGTWTITLVFFTPAELYRVDRFVPLSATH